MAKTKVDQVRALLKSIETGDPGPIAVVNEARYIQHNPQTHEGSEGLAALFQRLAKTGPRVNVVRAFEDGDFVFGHTEYDFASRKIGFEVFRFEDGQAVEHWDNIQERIGPNPSGRTMVDGTVDVDHSQNTEATRAHVRLFIESVLIAKEFGLLPEFLDPNRYTEHNPGLGDGLSNLRPALEEMEKGRWKINYQRLHRVLAEGDFALSVTEGTHMGHHASFYDLFRIEGGKIVEHWDTIEKIAPRSEWKNDNGKF